MILLKKRRNIILIDSGILLLTNITKSASVPKVQSDSAKTNAPGKYSILVNNTTYAYFLTLSTIIFNGSFSYILLLCIVYKLVYIN